MADKYAHCSYCGSPFAAGATWPRRCGVCGNITYRNPLPVAVLIVPVGEGVLLVRRAIPPQICKLALPGGYVGVGESWQAAGAREVFEETGILVAPDSVDDFVARSAPDGTVLIFGVAAPLAILPPFAASDEASELVVVTEPAELAFSLHTAALRLYFERKTLNRAEQK